MQFQTSPQIWVVLLIGLRKQLTFYDATTGFTAE